MRGKIFAAFVLCIGWTCSASADEPMSMAESHVVSWVQMLGLGRGAEFEGAGFQERMDRTWFELEQNWGEAADDAPQLPDLPDLGDEILIGADALRYFLSPLRDLAGNSIEPLFASLDYGVLKRRRDSLDLHLLLTRPVQIEVPDEDGEKKYLDLTHVLIPKEVRLTLSFQDDVFRMRVARSWNETIRVKMRMPQGILNTVSLRGLMVDLGKGRSTFEIGIARDLLRVVARVDLSKGKGEYDGIDFWASLWRSFKGDLKTAVR